jgi:hypothetical protein
VPKKQHGRPELTPARQTQLLKQLRERFERYPERHPGITWNEVEKKLLASPGACRSLYEMERTGGEPDCTGWDSQTGALVFCDCVAESPAGRRSCCYDAKALEARKENKPLRSAVETTEEMGIELLTEEQYRALQELGPFDSKTSSWIRTPDEIRKRGGALFGDFRYGQVFIYHNGASSYYAARGFRGRLLV